MPARVVPAAGSLSLRAPNGAPVRVAVVCDFREEGWASMDLVAEMLLEALRSDHGAAVAPTRIQPPMARRFTSLPVVGASRRALNADRLVNRFLEYPRRIRAEAGAFDVFHLIDHSYSQLLHELPAERTVVTCHDLDTFRCLLEPKRDPRSPPFRAMVQRTLDGFRRAARVACVSSVVRDEVLAHGLVPAERLRVVPNGVDLACSPAPDPEADAEAARLVGEVGTMDLLHVGTTIARKRIDVLLEVFAVVRRELPEVRLVRVGGALTPAQQALATQLGLSGAIITLPFLSRRVLAAVYRRAALVLQPSEAEGFGLPVAEAMACGTPVIASDLAVLREVGGHAAIFGPVGNVREWGRIIVELLVERAADPDRWAARRAAAVQYAERFSWAANARRMVSIYGELAGSSSENRATDEFG